MNGYAVLFLIIIGFLVALALTGIIHLPNISVWLH